MLHPAMGNHGLPIDRPCKRREIRKTLNETNNRKRHVKPNVSSFLSDRSRLTRAPITVVVDVDVDRVLEIATEFFRLLLRQSISSDNYNGVSY